MATAKLAESITHWVLCFPGSILRISHPTHQRLILPGPSASLLVETCAETLSTSSSLAKLPNVAIALKSLSNTSRPFRAPATGSRIPIVADSSTFLRKLSWTTLPTGIKREPSYPSQSITCVISDIGAKPRGM